MQRQRSVQEARTGERGAVLVERVARALDHARVAREAEVVVRAEHDPLGALHLHDRPGLALEQAEEREEALLPRGGQLLEPLVRARLLEDVFKGLLGHGLYSAAPCRSR